MKYNAILTLAVCTVLASRLEAGPLKEAKINQIVNDVKVVEPRHGARPAALQDLIKDDLGVATGIQSRAELLFQDATLTRLGAETFFSFQPGTRNLNLDRGSLLLQVPKNLGGAKIRAASVTASITGTTIMMEHLPGSRVKVVVLEGSLNLGVDGNPGSKVTLNAGRMVIMAPNAKSVPKPVEVDLRKLVRTSALIDPGLFKGKGKVSAAELPSMGLIEHEIALQDEGRKDHLLASADIETPGAGVENLGLGGSGQPNLTATTDLTTSDAATDTPLPPTSITPDLNDPNPATVGAVPVDGGGISDPSGSGTGTGEIIPPPSPTPPPPTATEPPPNPTTPPPAPITPPPAPITPPPPVTPPPPPVTPPPVTPPPPPPTANTLPVTITAPNPYLIDTATTITTDVSGPTITKNGSTSNGTIYSRTTDGSASTFLFGGTSGFDTATNFDTRFGMNAQGTFAPSGVATYKFADLYFMDPPVLDTVGGARDIALISEVGIGSRQNGGSSTVDLSGLRSLSMASVTGIIYLDQKTNFAAAAGSGFEFLHLHARSGDVYLKAGFAAPTADLFVDAEGTAIMNGAIQARNVTVIGGADSRMNGSVNAGVVDVTTLSGPVSVTGSIQATTLALHGKTVSVSGAITATNLDIIGTVGITPFASTSVIRAANIVLNSGSPLTLNGYDPKVAFTSGIDFSTVSKFTATAPELVLLGSVKLPDSVAATLNIGAGGINAPLSSLNGFERITVTGGSISIDDMHAGEIYVSGDIAGRELAGDEVVVGGAIRMLGKLESTKEDDIGELHTYTASSISALGQNSKGPLLGIVYDGQAGKATKAPTPGGLVELHANSIDFDNSGSGINGATLSGGDASASNNFEGGDGGALSVGSDARPIPGQINVNTPITATTGANGRLVTTGGAGGTVKLISNDTINVNATVKVSSATAGSASKSGGSVRIDSRRTTGTAINVANSGQLLALLAAAAPGPGGKVEFVSAGGDIRVTGGKVQADRGTVDIRNNGTGNVALTNATLSGDVVKVAAFGKDGQLIIGGGTINADSSLKLYAAGSNGEVRFTDDVTIGGASTKIIAGKTVTIDSGRTVTVGGTAAANVYTDRPNYTGSGGNGSTTGKFGGAGATTQGFSGRPSF